MKTGFFSALYGTCAGLSIFEKLKEQSLARAFLHLFLMSMISAIIIAFGVYPGIKRTLQSSLKTFVDNCQSVVCSNESIKPSLEPERARSFVINGPLAVTYLPADAQALPVDFHQDCTQGILWCADGKLLIWKSEDNKKYMIAPLGNPLANINASEVLGHEALFNSLKSSQPLKLNLEKGGVEILTPEKMQILTSMMVCIGVGGFLLRLTLFEVLIYIGIFTLVSLLMNLGRPQRRSLKEMVVLSIYAGFPPMLIGSFAEALKLPYLNFNIVYVMGMTLYLIIALNRLERLRQEREWREENR